MSSLFTVHEMHWGDCWVSVSLHVERQVIGPGEGAGAQVALEGLRPGVLSEVAGQLVRPATNTTLATSKKQKAGYLF